MDVLGNTMATGQISIARLYESLSGNPTLGRQVDIIPTRGTPDFFPERRSYVSSTGIFRMTLALRFPSPLNDAVTLLTYNSAWPKIPRGSR